MNYKDLVKTGFDFGWKKWKKPPIIAELAFQYQKGDILDVGCATCQLYNYLRKMGWKGRYFGIDIQKYEIISTKENIDFIVGDALKVNFPRVDTVILYNILEHVDDPLKLLKKSINAAKKMSLLMCRNEMKSYGDMV